MGTNFYWLIANIVLFIVSLAGAAAGLWLVLNVPLESCVK